MFQDWNISTDTLLTVDLSIYITGIKWFWLHLIHLSQNNVLLFNYLMKAKRLGKMGWVLLDDQQMSSKCETVHHPKDFCALRNS